MELTATAVFFDLDGTLIDSTPAIVRSWTTLAIEYGIPQERFAAVGAHGRPAAELIAQLLPGRSVTEPLSRIVELELADTADITVLPGVESLLAALPADRWGVVTSCTRPLAEARLFAVGIAPPLLVTADDVDNGKPSPEPFRLAAERFGMVPGTCVAVEDAPAGLLSARDAGMATIAVATTHPASALAADVVVAELSSVTARATSAGLTLRCG